MSTSDAGADRGAGQRLSVATMILFVVGAVLLVVAGASLTHLPEWADRWGQIPVFVVFFLLMSLAGRWFWAGIDAIIAGIKGR